MISPLFWGKSYGFSSVILLFPSGRFCFLGGHSCFPCACLFSFLVSFVTGRIFLLIPNRWIWQRWLLRPPRLHHLSSCTLAHATSWHFQWPPSVQHGFWPGCLKSVRACGAGTDAFHLCVVLTLGEQTSGRHKHNCLFWLTMTSSWILTMGLVFREVLCNNYKGAQEAHSIMVSLKCQLFIKRKNSCRGIKRYSFFSNLWSL